MPWYLMIALAALIFIINVKKGQEAGIWSWSRFALTLSFAVFEGLMISAQLFLMNMNSPYFVPVYIAILVVAVALFVWFVIMAKRWTRPREQSRVDAEQGRQR